jgi:hypothetical protein
MSKAIPLLPLWVFGVCFKGEFYYYYYYLNEVAEVITITLSRIKKNLPCNMPSKQRLGGEL